MDALLVRDLLLRRKTTFDSPAPLVLKTEPFCKKVELPFLPHDGTVLQDEHMCLQVDGVVYDLRNKSLLVRVKSESFYEEEKLASAETCYLALGWVPFPVTDAKE
jgi:hypothetical protein